MPDTARFNFLGRAMPMAPHPGDVFLPDGTRLVFLDPSDQARKFRLALQVPSLSTHLTLPG